MLVFELIFCLLVVYVQILWPVLLVYVGYKHCFLGITQAVVSIGNGLFIVLRGTLSLLELSIEVISSLKSN